MKIQTPLNLWGRLKVNVQYILPQSLLSRLMYHFARARLGGFSTWLIQRFIHTYQVDMQQAANADPSSYESFNAFFTRALKDNVRPIATAGITSPADGAISQMGAIKAGKLIQAKGHHFDLTALLGGEHSLAQLFQNGQFCTIYLAPRDYHRVHMPIRGKAVDMIYVPGRRFSVNHNTSLMVDGLFARNERLISLFKTDAGPVAMVMVGALFVGSIDTVWEGEIVPNNHKKVQRWQLPSATPILDKGAEMGRFNMGSTVILLFGKAQMQWLDTLNIGDPIQMGQALGNVTTSQ